MKSKIKSSIIIVFLFFGFLSSLKAQDKYEYAIVKYVTTAYPTRGIYVSINGKEFEKIEIKTSKELQSAAHFYDYTDGINYIQKMADNGWRIINTSAEGDILLFVLERKK